MNKQAFRLVFNRSRGCMMAVSESASSCSKSPSGTFKPRRRSSKCFKTTENDQFHLSNQPLAQWIRAQAATNSIAFKNFASGQINNLTINTTGSISNSGILQSGNALTLAALNITNNAAGQISANQTSVSVTNAMTNRGLIDGVQTQVNASTLSNIGTGRIYGDMLGIAATTLNNDAETVGGVTTAAVIAARTRLDIGAGTLNNSNGATLLSVGDAFIGGALDINKQAVGRATTINNTGATIQALGNLAVTAQTINNTNAGFSYALQTVAGPSDTVYSTAGGSYSASGGATPIPGPVAYFRTAGTGVATYLLGTNLGYLLVPGGAGYSVYGLMDYTSTTQQAVVTSSNPGKLTSGAAMTLDASSQINNTMSQILAGSALSITGSASINNIQTSIPVTVVQTGSFYTLGNYDSGGCGGGRCDRWTAYGQSYYYNALASSTTLQGSYQGNAPAQGQSAATPAVVTPAGSPAALPLVATVPSASSPGTQVRTNPAAQTNLPSSALYRINTNPTATYLIQTDPRFTNLRQWLSSDYMLTALNTNPSNILKRLGDGFYEQRLINEQVGQLTGRRFLGNFTSQDQQYQGLMDSGITIARQFNLRPGIALSATQMAQLTSDIVWLVEQTVTLPDGSRVQALVPQLYVANIRPGDIDGSGALLSAQAVNINITGDVNNSGTIGGNIGGNISGSINGRTLVQINAANINNLYGNIQGEQVSLNAANDITNTGGTLAAASALTINAGRDINLTSTTASNKGSGSPFTRTQLDRLAGVYVAGLNGTAGALQLLAGRDINAQAASITNTSNGGATTVQAGRDIALSTVSTDFAAATGGGANFFRMQTSQDVGSSITSNGNLTVSAGNNINAVAANIQSSQAATSLTAGNSINLLAGQRTSDMAWGSESKSSGFLSSSTTTKRATASGNQAQVTSVGGNSVTVLAGNNALLEGTNIAAQKDVLVYAGNQLIVAAARDTSSLSASSETYTRGIGMSLNPMQAIAQTGTRGGSTATTSASSTARGVEITSAQGNVGLAAGGAALIEGAQLSAAQGSVNITAANVIIQAAVNTSSTSTTTKTQGNPNINAIGYAKPGEGFGRKLTVTTGLEQTSLSRTTVSAQNVNITATQGDLRIAGTTVNTPGILSLNAKGQIALDGQQTQTISTLQSLGKDLAYQRMRDQGSIEQTTHYNQFNAGTVQFNAPNITAQIGSKDSAQQLAQQPGMAWVGQLLNDPATANKVNWTSLEDASKSWDYKKQGLTPAGAAVVSIVVAYFTAGAATTAGAAVAGGVGATGTTAAVIAGATTAAVSTLASQAAVSFINNQGDIGKTLQDLGSSSSVKALLTAMATGGVLAGMNFSPTGQPSINGGAQTFTSQLGQNLQAGVARSLISTAINGGSLEASLKGAITSAFIDTGAAQGAFAIGQSGPQGTQALNAFTAELAHAIAGCAAGAAGARGGSSASGGCSAGAIGAVVGHLAAQYFDPNAVGGTQTVQFAGMMSAIAAAATGADVAGINAAAGAGSNAAANNWLQPKEQQLRRQAAQTCGANAVTNANACGVVAALNKLDAQREAGNSGTLSKGITSGLISLLLSPVTVPVELMASIAESGGAETAIAILKGIALLPTNIALGLQSDNPEVQGKALVDALATAAGGAALMRSGMQVWTLNGVKAGGTAGELTGTRTVINTADDVATIRSLTRENESATTLANSGYKVEQNPPTLPNGKNPDYIVNGLVFDNYAPSTGNVRNAADRIGEKVAGGQANNVVVNLADSSITLSALSDQLTNYPIPGLKKVIIIDKTGIPTVIKFLEK